MSTGHEPLPALYPLALVAFSGNTDIRWLRLLRPGFRHVFVALNDGAHWITVDPLSHRTEVAVQPVGADFDLAGHYRRQGLRVIEFSPPPVLPRPAPVALCTCVEAAKRVLGIHHPFVLTPWQLYRHINRRGPARALLHPQNKRINPMKRFFSLTWNIMRSICRKVAAFWRAARNWTAGMRARLTNAAKALLS